jgi:hypothetical protein
MCQKRRKFPIPSIGEQATSSTVSGKLPWSICLDRCLEVTAQIIFIDFDVGPNSIQFKLLNPNGKSMINCIRIFGGINQCFV